MTKYEQYLTGRGYRPATVKTYKNEVKRYQLWLEREKLTATAPGYKDLLQLIREKREEGRSGKEINKHLRAIRLYYSHLIEEGEVRDNPAVGLRVKDTTRRIPHDLLEWDSLEELYRNYTVTGSQSQRNKVMLGLLVFQALTVEEIKSIAPGDLKLKEGKIKLPGSPRTSGRTLQLASLQILDLQEYLLVTREKLLKAARKTRFESGKRKITTLFFGAGGGEIKNGLGYLLRSLDPPVRAMKIRESVITHWLKTKDIRIVQYMAGHKYVSSTERYKEARLEDLREALEKFHPLNQQP